MSSSPIRKSVGSGFQIDYLFRCRRRNSVGVC
jgi:hypothetical protein